MRWKEADYFFEATYKHPFVQGIGKGELKKEQHIHYIKQDYEYLNAIIRYHPLMEKCTTDV